MTPTPTTVPITSTPTILGDGSVNVSGVNPNLALELLAGLVVFYILLLVLSVLVPIMSDINQAYRHARGTRELIFSKIAADKLDIDRLKLLLQDLDQSPPGIPGLGRSTMALTIILILGIAIVHLLVVPTNLGANNPIIGNVLTLLGGAVASIIGFYFGGKASNEASQQASQAAVSPTPTDQATAGALRITTPSPLKHATATQPYIITLDAAGGQKPYHWAILKQPDQGGLSIDPGGGTLTFLPTQATGPDGFDVPVQVTDSAHTTVSQPIRIIVDPAGG